MIERYCLQNMKNIWEIQEKFSYYLKVELAVCEAYCKIGRIPNEALKEIINNARFDVERIDEIEKEVNHDVIAFLTNINESLGENAKYMHLGLTSSDVIDTAFALQIKEASKIISNDLAELIVVIKNLAKKHKETICIGRSHGIHAEVMTFGVKLLYWTDILERAYKYFLIASDEVAMGKISGPVGTYSNISPQIEEIVCEKLGLKPAKISTQVIARDIHSRYMNELAMIATVIEQFATEIRSLQRTEIFELQEGFFTKQKGSSAMPHKRNPILCENLCGLARVVRSNAFSAMQNVVLWHERDMSHSSAERIILPDSTILIDFMLNRFKNVMENLVVNEQKMLKNADMHGGIIYSQKIMLKLIEKGLTREEAYEIVQKNAFVAIDENTSFKLNIKKDSRVLEKLSNEEIENCFLQSEYLKNIESVFQKFD